MYIYDKESISYSFSLKVSCSTFFVSKNYPFNNVYDLLYNMCFSCTPIPSPSYIIGVCREYDHR